jgi:hypothetical protein
MVAQARMVETGRKLTANLRYSLSRQEAACGNLMAWPLKTAALKAMAGRRNFGLDPGPGPKPKLFWALPPLPRVN